MRATVRDGSSRSHNLRRARQINVNSVSLSANSHPHKIRAHSLPFESEETRIELVMSCGVVHERIIANALNDKR